MSVFVVGLNGCRLMPVSERKARLILNDGKASVYRKVPFTIKLNYKTGSTTQPGYLGIDTGSQHIGVSVVREGGTVLHKEEIGLRDSMTKRKLLEAKASLRRGRRCRKIRYRHPKWRMVSVNTEESRSEFLLKKSVEHIVNFEDDMAETVLKKLGFTEAEMEKYTTEAL